MRLASIVTISALLVAFAFGQDLEITSFDTNGRLTWTNSVSNATYRIEWSPSLQSPWQTNSPFNLIQGTSTVMAAEVPMFYRVVWVDPAFDINGVVYYSTNPLANHPVRLYDLDWNLLTTVTSRVTGEYTVTGVTNGNYWFGPGSQGGYLGFSRETTISNGDLTMDLYTHRSFETISPTNNATVTTDSPSFAWERLPEAHTFRFQLNVWDPFEMIENTSDIQTNLF